jgi:flagellar protein FlaG
LELGAGYKEVSDMNISNINPFLNDINQNVQPINQDRRPENNNSQAYQDVNQTIKDTEELKKIIEELQNKMSYLNKSLKIEFDKEIKEPIVKIIDITSNEVIRQIPPDHIINIIKNINKMFGALLNEKV